MDDTTPEVKQKMREMMRARTGAERVIMGASMFDAARRLIIASLPKDITAEELKRRLFERTYGETLEQFLTRAE
jgi:hypothetical protein